MKPDTPYHALFSPQPLHNCFVANIKASCDFYTHKLGFSVDCVYGDPPYYGQVSRDHARLALRMVGEPVLIGDIRKREHLLSASITLAAADEIKQLLLSYQAAGVRFDQTLKKDPWGARTFIVMDPDGNLILFAGPCRLKCGALQQADNRISRYYRFRTRGPLKPWG